MYGNIEILPETDAKIEGDFQSITMPLFEKEKPFFFIKNSLVDKKYRISASFEYLNKKLGINIEIVRKFEKINFDYCTVLKEPKTSEEMNGSRTIEYTNDFKLIKLYEIKENKNKNNLYIFKYLPDDNISKTFLKNSDTSFYIIRKLFEDKNDCTMADTVVFFSKKYPTINEYFIKLNS